LAVANKRGRIPPAKGIHAQSRTKIELTYSDEGNGLRIGVVEGEDESKWIASLKSSIHGTLYIPQTTFPHDNVTTSRFIGKAALEILAQRCIDSSGWNAEIVDKRELDTLRTYVRMGVPNTIWPINIRRIYAPDYVFSDGTSDSYQVLHEWTILHLPMMEYFVILAIFGIEYAINLGNPEIGGYIDWLNLNKDRSPLYLTNTLQSDI